MQDLNNHSEYGFYFLYENSNMFIIIDSTSQKYKQCLYLYVWQEMRNIYNSYFKNKWYLNNRKVRLFF